MTTDNPAARLLAILKKGNDLPEHMLTKEAWKKIMSIEDQGIDSESILMAKLSQFMLLPHEVQALMAHHYPQQAEDLSYAMSKVQAAIISQNLSGQWNTFKNHIDQHSLSALSMSSALLDHKLETKLIEENELNNFKIKLQEILDEVVNANLNSDFKKYINHYLQKILSTINDYLISGAQPIMDALEATLGHAVLDPSFKESLKETDTGNKIRKVVADLANVVTIATAATGATAYIANNGFPLLG